MELEFNPFITTPDKILMVIQRLQTVRQGSTLLYSENEKEELNKTIGLVLTGENFINSNYFNTGRNLHQVDVPYLKSKNYFVSYKVDGIRKILIFHDNKIWLVFPPLEFDLLQITEKRLVTQIYEGEVITSEKMSWYIPYDCLVSKKLENEKKSIVLTDFP